MANICKYKVIVKGKRNACMAFFGSMPCLDDKWINSDEGTNENCKIFFEGDCKWSVDFYCKSWSDKFPVDLPEDMDEALQFAEENYWYYTVSDRSKMFNVEVLCNSADIDDYMGSNFEHYINGEQIFDSCPKELDIAGEYGFEDDCDRPSEPSEKDRVKAYYKSGDGNEFKYFEIHYENLAINEILEKYNYILKDTDGVDLMDTNDPCDIVVQINIDTTNPNYAGVTNLENLTLTLINLLITIGTAKSGFAEELISRKDEIIKVFSNISGTSQETCDFDAKIGMFEDPLSDGYDFELIDGVYEATYRTCVAGW